LFINLLIYLNTHKEGINDLIAKMKKGPMKTKGLGSIKYSVQDTTEQNITYYAPQWTFEPFTRMHL